MGKAEQFDVSVDLMECECNLLMTSSVTFDCSLLQPSVLLRWEAGSLSRSQYWPGHSVKFGQDVVDIGEATPCRH
jgi:hypothetical protein